MSSRPSRRRLLLGGFAWALAGCGFEPEYKPRADAASPGSAATDLSFVYVSPIPDRNGQLVRNALVELLGIAQEVDDPVFRLDIQLRESREGLAIEQDTTITRYNLRLNAAFSLKDERIRAEVLQGNTRAIAAYNVVESRYAKLVAERDARARAARFVAVNIRDQLSVFFSRQRV